MRKNLSVMLSVFVLLAFSVAPALAAASAESVNLPGWVGWLLAILAIVLMLGFRVYFLNNRGGR